MTNKFKEFFIKENYPYDITPWYHGFFYNKFDANKIITIFLPLAPIARLLRAIYFHFKFGSHELRDFYLTQIKLREEKEYDK